MKQRNIIAVAIFTVLTLGIYYFIWLYKTKEELKKLGNRIPPLILLLLSYVPLIGLVAAGSMMPTDESAPLNNVDLFAGIFLLLCVVMTIPFNLYWYYKYCRAVNRAINNTMSFGALYAFVIVSNLLGVQAALVLIFQDYFNKASSSRLES